MLYYKPVMDSGETVSLQKMKIMMEKIVQFYHNKKTLESYCVINMSNSQFPSNTLTRNQVLVLAKIVQEITG